MNSNIIKSGLTFAGGIIVAGLLLWMGTKLLFFDREISNQGMFLIGVATVLAGVIVMPSQQLPKALPLGIVLILVGIYYFARAAGVFEHAILIRLLGVASISAAAIIIYMTLPRPNKHH